VGIDIVFAEPDRTSPETMRRMFREELKLDVAFDGLPPAWATMTRFWPMY
jgi:adenylate cyclase